MKNLPYTCCNTVHPPSESVLLMCYFLCIVCCCNPANRAFLAWDAKRRDPGNEVGGATPAKRLLGSRIHADKKFKMAVVIRRCFESQVAEELC